MRLKDRVVIITGGGRGIGRGIALRFAQEGAAVALADRDAAASRQTAEEVRALGGKVLALAVDVSHKAQVRRMVDETAGHFGGVDILVNNAGISKVIPFLETTEEDWDRILAVNLKGAFLCCQTVLPIMVKRGKGKIINMSSQSGKTGNSWYAAYCASKFGLIGLTQSLAAEFAPHGITVNAICPGVIFTSMWEEQLPDYARKKNLAPDQVKSYLEKRIPLGHLGRVEDVANLALFLASDESDYMTGQALNITGGEEVH
jgi:3-hydroxybutyrate dehydrogenase